MTDTKTVYKPKAIDITSIGLLNFQSQLIDLTSLFTDFHVYEDIMTNTMSCSVQILDSLGILERFPIIGEELLYIEFKTPTFDEPEATIVGIFDITKIADRQKVQERADSYRLYGVSREFIFGNNKTADKAYRGFLVSDVVKLVYNNILKDKQKNKEVFVEPSRGLQSFIAPESSPLEFINFLCSEAQSEQYPLNSNYVFYEDHVQFNFRTIAGLFEQEPVEDFYWAEFDTPEDRSSSEEKVDESQRIIYIEYLNQFDILKQTNSGLLDNSSLTIDLIFKKTEDKTFIYDQDYQKLKSLGSAKITSPSSSAIDGTGVSHKRYLISNLSLGNYSQTSYLNKRCPPIDPTNFFPFVRHKFINTTVAATASLNNIMMHVEIPGNSRIKAGDVINIFIPSSDSNEEEKNTYNKLYGDKSSLAKFLVIRVDHFYNKQANEYTTMMKVVKDAYANEPIGDIPDQE